MFRYHYRCAVAAITILVASSALASDRISPVTRFLSADGTPLPANWHANQEAPTFLVIHGFHARGTDATSIEQASAIQRRFPRANVVVVDWAVPSDSSRLQHTKVSVSTSDFWTSVCDLSAEYERAVHASRGVGRSIADWMQDKRIEPSRTVICGHSLGAHIASFASKHLARTGTLGHKLHAILAADPAGPSFAGAPAEERLDKSDAEEVIVVHTTDFSGDNHAIGTFDIYVSWRNVPPDVITRHSMARELITRSFLDPKMVTNDGLPFAANAIDRHCRSDKAQGFVVADENIEIAARSEVVAVTP